jgi:hypothetical protein
MLANAIFAAAVMLLAIGLWLLEECQFLVPFRHVIFLKYGPLLARLGAVLFLNLVAAFYWIGRYLFLKDTGRKLAHLEKQLRTGEPLADDLSRRLKEETHEP